MIKVCKNCRYWCASALEHNMIGYCEGGNNKYMPEHIRVKHRTHEACSMFKPIQEAQDIIDEAYQQGRADALNQLLAEFCTVCDQEACEGGQIGSIQECETIKMMRDLAEQIKEQKDDNN